MACFPAQTAESVAKMPNAAPDSSNVSNELTNVINAENASARYSRDAESLIDEIQSYIPEGSGSQRDLGKGENALVSQNAKLIVKFGDIADSAFREGEAVRTIGPYTNTTFNELSSFAKITNWNSAKLATDKALIGRWAMRFVPSEGRLITDNPLYGALEVGKGQTQGSLQVMNGEVTTIFRNHDSVVKLERESQFDREGVCHLVADYAMTQHAPERNETLRRQWGEDIARGQRPNASTNERKQAAESYRHLQDSLAYKDEPTVPDHIVKGGLLEGEAAVMRDKIVQLLGGEKNIPLIETAAQQFRNAINYVTEQGVKNGNITREMIESFPRDWNFYVMVRTRAANNSGAMNDPSAFHYTQASPTRKAFEGNKGKPDNAYITLERYMRTVAREAGNTQFGNMLAHAFNHVRKIEGGKYNPSGFYVGTSATDNRVHHFNGLEAVRYDPLMAAANRTSHPLHKEAVSLLSRDGGIVTWMPKYDRNNNQTGMERVFLSFNPEWKDPTDPALNGKALAEALKLNTREPNKALSAMTTATSGVGQLFTRFTATFAPLVNMPSDAIEKMFNMSTRVMRRADGTEFGGWSAVPQYMMNLPRAFGILKDMALYGKDVLPSHFRQIADAYERNGLHMEFTKGMKEERVDIDKMIRDGTVRASDIEAALKSQAKTNSGAREILKQMGSLTEPVRNKVMGVLNGWNDVFNNVAGFSQFLTLMEKGVAEKDAARYVLQDMNLYNTGQAVPFLRAWFPFVKPTIQTGVAMARSLGLAPNASGKFQPNVRGLALLAGSVLAFSSILPLLRQSYGVDDRGNAVIDTIPLSELSRSIRIYTGDKDYVKLYGGFGIWQLGTTIAVDWDRHDRGLISTADMVFDILTTVIKNVSPGNWPDFSIKTDPVAYLFKAFSPTILTPFTEVGFNKNYRGWDIYNEQRSPYVAKSESGRATTEQGYHMFARLVDKLMGVDYQPEIYKSLLNNMAAGPLQIVARFIEDGTIGEMLGIEGTELRRKTMLPGEQTTRELLGPWLGALGISRIYGKAGDANRNFFWQANNALNDRIADERINMRVEGAKGNNEQKQQYVDDVRYGRLIEHGWTEADARDAVMLIRQAQNLRNLSTKTTEAFNLLHANDAPIEDMRDLFDRYAEQAVEIYTKSVSELEYFRSR